MLKHNIVIFLRNIKKHKSTFFINVLGLSSGIVCVLLIALWVMDEQEVDRFHENDERLYQVMLNFENDADIMTVDWTPAPLAKALVSEIPEVEKAITVFSPGDKGILSKVNDAGVRTKELFASNDFFKVFSFDLIQGTPDKVLENENAIVISEDMAVKLFGSVANSMGKTLSWKQGKLSGLYQVSGVFKKPSSQSSLEFDAVFSFDHFLRKNPDFNQWVYNDPSTFVLLKEDTDISLLNAKMTQLLQEKPNVQIASAFLYQFSKRHLHGKFVHGIPSGGRITYIRLFSLVAFFILLIAAINFVNLSTAQASRRVKEIGVKKAMGAFRKTLMLQYLLEAFFLSFLSVCTALIFVIMFLPQFNIIIGKPLILSFNTNLVFLLLGIVFLTALIAGSYPALYLSGFQPLSLLKGKLQTKAKDLWVRQGLVVFQFTVSIVLIVAVITVTKQINYVQHKNLGYDKEHVILFERDGNITESLESFLLEVQNIPGVVDATSAYHEIMNNDTSTKGISWEGLNTDNQIPFKYINANYNFIEVLDIKLKEGRTFSRKFSSENEKVILNETAIAQIGLQDPIGKTIDIWGQKREIIGVVADFHFESLYEEVQPLFFNLHLGGNDIMVRLEAGSQQETLARLQEFYGKFNDSLTFNFRFLDQDYQELYASEKRISVLSKYFGGLAILISCLGLFGLAAFTAERKRKEIGIRKVLGQSATQITLMLSNEFLKLVLISACIGLPIAYYYSNEWLSNFAYNVPLSVWYFLGTGILSLFIALFTVGSQAITAANRNPIHVIREE
ncbi:ABC transporter permease [Spongiimicrobium salis]|uniref:ABC transporter permease n=1 Tax=Spongiimicrobium salis TaxID=1667022 RepID=UPI00374DF02F